jgi:hypothetical protein
LAEHGIKKEDGSSTLESLENSSSSVSDKEAGARKVYSSWFPWRRSQTSQDQSNVDHLNSSPESRSSLKDKESPQGKFPVSLSKSISGGKNNQQVQSVTSSSDESEGTGGRQDKAVRPSRSGTLPIAIEAINVPEKFKKTLRLNSGQIVRSCIQFKN